MSEKEDWFAHPEDAPEEQVSFLQEDTDYFPADPQKLVDWIQTVTSRENRQLSFVNFIFCSDEFLHHLNVQYLNHDTLTDVITFPYADPPRIEGDIFISIDRVRDNANDLRIPWEQELYRVMIHGLLHLCGYSDKRDTEKKEMTEKENQALAILFSLPD